MTRQALFEVRLNQAQREAVQTIQGPLLCIAGAGTGKTATLVARVAYMIEQGIDPANILLLTFTRKAAAEMLDRAARMFGQQCYEVEGGTFHSFANRLLRQHGAAIGLSQYSIIDQADVEDIIRMQLDELGLTGKGKGRDLPTPATLRAMFGKKVNWGLSLADIVTKEYRDYGGCIDVLAQVWEAVDWYKVIHGLLDYDDLLTQACRLLDQQADIAERVSEQYRYIMVDEYQDTNILQAEMVMWIGGGYGNVMAVGDDAQSIYAFRGANYRNILDFPNQFPGCKVVRLEENFRSVQPILDVTNRVIAQATEAFRKTLFSARTGMLPYLVTCWDEQAQSRYVVETVQRLQRSGVPLTDMAVLMRSSFMSYDLELELNAAGIPFVKVGGLRFLESRHVKDVLAYVRALVNRKDVLAWHRILMMVPGVGVKTAGKIFAALAEQPDPYAWLAECPLKGVWRDDVRKLGAMLHAARDLTLTTAEQMMVVIAHYLPILREVEPSEREYVRRREGLEYLVSMAGSYLTLAEFLSNVALEPPDRMSQSGLQTADEEQVEVQDRLTLSTIHSAKGLEWRVVFALWLTEGRFPSLYAYEAEERLEEELRLLYVALTRAKDELHVCNPTYFDHRAGLTFSNLSSYLRPVPSEYWQPVLATGVEPQALVRGRVKTVPVEDFVCANSSVSVANL